MEKILRAAIERGASDLHIKAGDVFRARINGELVPMTKQLLTPEQTREVAMRLIPNERDRNNIDRITDYDCAWGVPGLGRFRVNILRQRGSFMIVLRIIPVEIPNFEQLGLPGQLGEIAELPRGLILVTGVTGSGKTTTQAAIIGHINQTFRKHIITLENPIEYLHRDINCSITQREIGSDTSSFQTGLRAALREDPDVILIGEMRDTETMDTAIKATETGHLVISTLHTPDAATTISRMISVFPPEEQEMLRVRLAEALASVVSQRLLPRLDGQGRILACELLRKTGAIRDCILDPQRIDEIRYLMEEGKNYGMQTFDQHLRDLVQAELVDYEVAKQAATNPTDFELKMKTLGEDQLIEGMM
ncbi:MAG: PilT/PilU family type 4a pilus ATPase [Gemmatimonadota bacterium]|nr:PilT/PilU family type 4a pilus ATPase [Candidatus Palauibacterales bacterium]